LGVHLNIDLEVLRTTTLEVPVIILEVRLITDLEVPLKAVEKEVLKMPQTGTVQLLINQITMTRIGITIITMMA
jgi:hypothetical protein